MLDARSDEALLLGVLGITLLVAGIAQQLDVSAAVGAFLVGIAISGPVRPPRSRSSNPLRDLFAALFFILFGFRSIPATSRGAAPGVAAAVVTASPRWPRAGGPPAAGVGRGRMRAGTALIARGEFSIVIAGLALGTGSSPTWRARRSFVLLLVIAGPVAHQVRRPPRGAGSRPAS